MSKYKYTAASLDGGIVAIGDTATDEHEAFIPIGCITSVAVDWTVESGQLTVNAHHDTYVVVFDEPDHGQTCADFISDLFKAWRDA